MAHIKVRSELLRPKHQHAIGIRLWLFLYLIDRADWGTGVVYGYTDGEASQTLGRPHATVKRWRRDLEERGYISCRQGFRCQIITIHRWIDPRDGDHHPARKVIPLTLYSESESIWEETSEQGVVSY
jgi:hypothetical protein